jgi:eukaryotic-like serine/threonine-protein kinase
MGARCIGQRDTRLGREVASKVLPVDRVSDPDRRRRFVQEAQAASALNHPHIITIYEIESRTGRQRDYSTLFAIKARALPSTTPRISLPLLTITKCWGIGGAPGVGKSTAVPVQSGLTV